MIQRRKLAVFMIVMAIAACNNEKVRNLIDERAEEASRSIQEAKLPAPAKSYDPLVITNKIWAGNSSIRLRRGMPLPPRVEGSKGITLISADPMSLGEIANAISSQTGIPVKIAPGTVSSASIPMPLPMQTDLTGGSGTSGSGFITGDGMLIAFEGPLSGLLDHVASYFGISWRYDGSAINFSKFETRVFIVEAMPGTQTVKDGMKESQDSGGGGSSGGSSAGGGGTSSLDQSSEMNAELKTWDEIKETITAILGGVGNVVVAPSSGTVTVTTTPEIMRTVAKYIEEENKRLSRQIAINVEVYKVELAQGSDFSFSFTEILKKMSNIRQFTFTGATNLQPVSGSPTGGDIGTAASLNVAILNPSGRGDTNMLFQALSAIGDTTRVAQFPLTTLNNRPVSRRIGRDRAYVSSVQNTTLAGAGAGASVSSTITPATIREGFSLQLTPRLLDDGRIMLQYSLSLTDIVQIRSFGDVAGGNGVQLPETASRVFVQQSLLRSGATLILAGVDDEQTNQAAQGVGHPFNFLLGGGSSNSTSRSMMFIAITPQVLDVQQPEQG